MVVKNQNQLTRLLVGVLISMKNTFPIEKTHLVFINNNDIPGHSIFCLQGNAGSAGAEGKLVSLGLDQKVCLTR